MTETVTLDAKHAEYILTALCATYTSFGQYAGPEFELALNALAESLYGIPLRDENGLVGT